ncbi:MAG TPA: PaaI family thioesterase [Terriglobales bacterium]|nr:PaaI family thioesterase [Terriglobales bacterium]
MASRTVEEDCRNPQQLSPETPKLETTCIACGRDNPNGLQLRFSITDDGVAVAPWVPRKGWEGFENVIHGGVVTTVLDESMAKAIVATNDQGLTVEMKVRFRHSVHPGENLNVRGWIVQRQRRLVRAEASLSDRDGTERAHAWATFMVLPGVHPHHAF